MDQLGTLIKRIEILIAYQRINLPDNCAYVIFCKLSVFLACDAVTGYDTGNGQHGNGLGGAVAQLLGSGQRIQ